MDTSNTKKPISLVISNILDNTYFRVYFGVLVLFPLSFILFICGILIISLNFSNIIVSILALTGLIGISGAWLRIIKTGVTMDSDTRKMTRGLLMIGLVTCAGFLIISFKDGFRDIFNIVTIVAFYIPGIFGTLMLVGTPNIEKEEIKA